VILTWGLCTRRGGTDHVFWCAVGSADGGTVRRVPELGNNSKRRCGRIGTCGCAYSYTRACPGTG